MRHIRNASERRQTAGLPAVMGTAGALGTVAWLVGRSGPEVLAQVFLVAAPIRIVTGYMDVPARLPLFRRFQGRMAHLVSMGSVAALNSVPSLFLGMAGIYTEERATVARPAASGGSVSAYDDIQRCRQQLWWWSSGVALGTVVWTGSIRRALAVMLAGNPSALITALAIATWRETAHWHRRGVHALHPLSLMTAGEVDTVLFELPEQPGAAYGLQLGAVLPRLRAAGYAVGFLSATADDETRALARQVAVDCWYIGTPEERAGWVGKLRAQGRTIAVVGVTEQSSAAMAAAQLAVAGPDGPAVGWAQVALAEPAAALPAVLVESRRHNQTARRVVTVSRSLAVAATVATAVGVLAATNVLTVANIIGLGVITLNQAFRKRRQGYRP